ncbi:MAG: HAD-IIB family hydrolase [Pirellulaceae bacterium]|nr:HAD-IIB family hydrolase [Pirellulaceae bacterium]
MRYQVLATDYDGTLATNGVVALTTVEALKKLLATGRRLVLVTGRELDELQAIFPYLDLFDWVVAENGGLLYQPLSKEEHTLAKAPSLRFVETLRGNGCNDMSVGRVIVATWEPYQRIVLETIRQLGLELQVIFNKGAVMVLPAGINKATGLSAALEKMSISSHNTIAVGDAENDHAMLNMCEFSVAVSNAIPSIVEAVDWTTSADHGQGVEELIDKIIADDLGEWECKLSRHQLEIGTDNNGSVYLLPYSDSVLIAGPSASGKSTVATQIVETLAEKKYQFCLVDPEGDYENFDQAVVLGGPKGHPQIEEAMSILDNPDTSIVISMTGMPIPDRPPYFLELLSKLLEMRSRFGRPHWLVLDEAHHLLPADWLPPGGLLPDKLKSMLFITVHPKMLSTSILERLDTLIAVGADAAENLAYFTYLRKNPSVNWRCKPLEKGQVLYSTRRRGDRRIVQVHPCKQDRKRHRRKYAKGELTPERSFYFQGPEKKLNLRAQNLMLFLQLADGVDDETWEYHRQEGDYSKWLLVSIKDEELAKNVALIESLRAIDPIDGRNQIRTLIERDYTLPSEGPLPVPGAS